MTYWAPEGYHQLGEGEYAGVTASAVLERFREATKTKTMFELADWLGVRASFVSDVQRRNIMPVAWLRLLVERKSEYNPTWVLTGQGEKFWKSGVL